MNILVFDTESDGFVEEATTAWCACTTDNRGRTRSYPTDKIPEFLSVLRGADLIVAHHLIGHDLPLLEKIHGYVHKGLVLDTLILSRLLNPDLIGGHSIEAWGERFGVPKPVHEDWSKYSPEMLHRCSVDTDINHRLLYHLMKEANLTEEDLK